MDKIELIDRICEINKSAKPELFISFSEQELQNYLVHLMELDFVELEVCS